MLGGCEIASLVWATHADQSFLRSQRTLAMRPTSPTGMQIAQVNVSLGVICAMPQQIAAVIAIPTYRRQDRSSSPSSRRSKIAMALFAA
nr:putative integron gene cassette protein [uncultured bacterium]